MKEQKLKFMTNLERQLWEMLYRSQTALSIMCLDEANREREFHNDWPAGQEWHELVGSSHASFNRVARNRAGIDNKKYLHILRDYDDDGISERLYEQFVQDNNRIHSPELESNNALAADEDRAVK